MNEPDALAMTLARNAYESGAPIELWAGLVMEAHGIEHNLPKTRLELLKALMDDTAQTRRTLNNRNR